MSRFNFCNICSFIHRIIIFTYFSRASEFHSFRENLCNKSKDEDLELYKGPKFYHPSDCAASEEIIEDIMQNNKKSLELHRIAKKYSIMFLFRLLFIYHCKANMI